MKTPLLALAIAATAAPVVAAPALKFDFGTPTAAPGMLAVTPQTAYSTERGYGFEAGAAITAFGDATPDAVRGDGCTATAPFFFSAKVPAGNYRVRVTLGAAESASVTTLKAEARRWMRSDVATTAGQWKTETFVVATKTPALQTGDAINFRDDDREWDDRLTLEFAGAAPRVCAVEIEPVEDLPTIFIVGDSTVTNQRIAPRSGWGQMLPLFFGPDVIISNHAEGGESLLRFAESKRLQKVLELIRPGDWMLIQFGHNDQKKDRPYYVEPFTTYQAELLRYANAARAKGATPIFLTSPQRRTFSREGVLRNTLGDYPAAMRDLAARENITLLDLGADSEKWLTAMGPQNSVKAYSIFPANTYPDQSEALNDNTHFNQSGAFDLASFVAADVRRQVPALARFLSDDAPHPVK